MLTVLIARMIRINDSDNNNHLANPIVKLSFRDHSHSYNTSKKKHVGIVDCDRDGV